MKANAKKMKTAISQSDVAILDLAPEARVRRQAGVVLCHVDGKHMLVPAMTNEVELDCLFLLNATGVFIWEHLDGRQRVRELGKALANAFAIDFEAATDDASCFLSSLLDHNLVELAEPHW
jgi:hypothetical protein